VKLIVSLRMRLSFSLLILFILSQALFGQQTVIGLDFEMEYSAAREALESRGFVAIAGVDKNFVNETGDTRVELGFAGEEVRLKCISIIILGENADNLEETALQMLVAFHGDDYDYDHYMREAWWKLDEFHFLNAAMVEDEQAYVIFYGDIREEELNPY